MPIEPNYRDLALLASLKREYLGSFNNRDKRIDHLALRRLIQLNLVIEFIDNTYCVRREPQFGTGC